MGKYLNYCITLGVAAFVFYAIVMTQRRLPRVQQVQFNEWYEEISQDFESMPLEKVPEVDISLQAPAKGLGFDWSLSTKSKDEKQVDQVQRLLEFIKNAELFGGSEPDEASQLTLVVAGPKKRFEIRLGLSQIQSDIRLQNFITLFQVFAPENNHEQERKIS